VLSLDDLGDIIEPTERHNANNWPSGEGLEGAFYLSIDGISIKFHKNYGAVVLWLGRTSLNYSRISVPSNGVITDYLHWIESNFAYVGTNSMNMIGLISAQSIILFSKKFRVNSRLIGGLP
jgi:hypothetical protein